MSTAYAVAAGASMIHPSVPAVMVTPICPHSLSFRPIVVPAGVELKVSFRVSVGVCWRVFRRGLWEGFSSEFLGGFFVACLLAWWGSRVHLLDRAPFDDAALFSGGKKKYSIINEAAIPHNYIWTPYRGFNGGSPEVPFSAIVLSCFSSFARDGPHGFHVLQSCRFASDCFLFFDFLSPKRGVAP